MSGQTLSSRKTGAGHLQLNDNSIIQGETIRFKTPRLRTNHFNSILRFKVVSLRGNTCYTTILKWLNPASVQMFVVSFPSGFIGGYSN